MGGQDIGNVKNVNFSGIHPNGSSGAAAAINWTNGQKQSITLTDDVAFTFAGGVEGGNYILKMAQDATGGWVPTWPANVKASGASIRVSVGIATETVLALYFDGSFYHLSSSPDSTDGVTTDPV
jgi:hypothetical protein